MKVYVCELNQHDMLRYKDFAPDILDGRKAVQFKDDEGHIGILYMRQEQIEKLGIEYLGKHSKLEWSDVCGEWFVTVSENAYYNDPVRFPPKVIPVKYVEDKMGEYTEVWRNVDNGKYYLRMLCNEAFARWMTADKRMYGYEDQSCIRANITFVNVDNRETEKVTYNDWNGNAAYPDTFNPAFNKQK